MRLILSPFGPRNQMIPQVYQSSDLCEIRQRRGQEVCLPIGAPWEGVLTSEELLFCLHTPAFSVTCIGDIFPGRGHSHMEQTGMLVRNFVDCSQSPIFP